MQLKLCTAPAGNWPVKGGEMKGRVPYLIIPTLSSAGALLSGTFSNNKPEMLPKRQLL